MGRTSFTQFRLLIGLAVLMPALLFAAAIWHDYIDLVTTAENNARTTVAMLREHALRAIMTQEVLLRAIDRRVRGLDWDQIRSASPELSQDMQAMYRAVPDVASLSLVDGQGRIWASSAPLGPDGFIAVNHQEHWLVQRDADRGTYISRPHIGDLTKAVNLAVSRRRSTPDGRFDGTVYVAISATYFSHAWAEAIGGQPGAGVNLVRDDGELLARYPERDGSLARFPTINRPFMRRVAAQPNGGIFRSVSVIDGVHRVYAFEQIDGYPLSIGYGVSLAAVLMTWWQHVAVLGTLCILGSVGLILAMLSIQRQMRLLAGEQARRAAVEQAAIEGHRLEILGQLAAGVAHDFANIIQVMRGGAVLIEKNARDPERVTTLAHMLGEAAARGESLTRRMLDFARGTSDDGHAGGQSHSETTNLAEAISFVSHLLSRTLGAQHRVRCAIDGENLPTRVRGDRSALEAVVMNLAINARDAMPQGGEIVVQLAHDHVRDDEAPRSEGLVAHSVGLPSGQYARVAVIDAGTGMPPEVLARATEAFFTTKPRGKGTGLGLAGARAFAEGCGGAIHIDSTVGQGTTVVFWLPAVDAADNGTAPSSEPQRDGKLAQFRPD
jgi:signal transduction histidine kinase